MEFRDLSFERELCCFWVLEGGSFLNEREREREERFCIGLDWIGFGRSELKTK